MNKKDFANIVWLKILIALISLAFLICIYIFLPTTTNHWIKLIESIIPNAIVVIATFILWYFLFYLPGIPNEEDKNIDENKLAENIVNKLKNEQALNCNLVEFNETFREVDWKQKLSKANHHIDIVVYYFDSWIVMNFNELVAFLQKPKTTIRIIVADPEVPSVIDELLRLFPEYSKETIREKVIKTGTLMRDVAKNAGVSEERISFYLSPHPLSYSAQVIDNKQLIISIFEMTRKLKIDSPAFTIDLINNKLVSNFIDKELKELEKEAKKA